MSAWFDLPDFEGWGDQWSMLSAEIAAIPAHPIAELNDADRADPSLITPWHLPTRPWWRQLYDLFQQEASQ